MARFIEEIVADSTLLEQLLNSTITFVIEHNGETIHFSPLDYSTKDEAKQHLVHIFKPKEEPKIET